MFLGFIRIGIAEEIQLGHSQKISKSKPFFNSRLLNYQRKIK